MSPDERTRVAARLAAAALWNRGLIGAAQMDAVAEVIAIYTRDTQQAERCRCAEIATDRGRQMRTDDPDLKSWVTRGAVTMAEGIAKKILEEGGR